MEGKSSRFVFMIIIVTLVEKLQIKILPPAICRAIAMQKKSIIYGRCNIVSIIELWCVASVGLLHS